jgi:hypothetical protein
VLHWAEKANYSKRSQEKRERSITTKGYYQGRKERDTKSQTTKRKDRAPAIKKTP